MPIDFDKKLNYVTIGESRITIVHKEQALYVFIGLAVLFQLVSMMWNWLHELLSGPYLGLLLLIAIGYVLYVYGRHALGTDIPRTTTIDFAKQEVTFTYTSATGKKICVPFDDDRPLRAVTDVYPGQVERVALVLVVGEQKWTIRVYSGPNGDEDKREAEYVANYINSELKRRDVRALQPMEESRVNQLISQQKTPEAAQPVNLVMGLKLNPDYVTFRESSIAIKNEIGIVIMMSVFLCLALLACIVSMLMMSVFELGSNVTLLSGIIMISLLCYCFSRKLFPETTTIDFASQKITVTGLTGRVRRMFDYGDVPVKAVATIITTYGVPTRADLALEIGSQRWKLRGYDTLDNPETELLINAINDKLKRHGNQRYFPY